MLQEKDERWINGVVEIGRSSLRRRVAAAGNGKLSTWQVAGAIDNEQPNAKFRVFSIYTIL